MCRRRRPGWLASVLIAVCLLIPGGLVAQDASVRAVLHPDEATLLRAVDSLMPLLERSEERLTRVEARRIEVMSDLTALALDTIFFGQIRVVTAEEDSDAARRLIRETLDEQFPGVEHREGLRDEWFVFQWKDHSAFHTSRTPWRGVVEAEATEAEAREAVARMIRAGLFNELMMDQGGISSWGLSGALTDPSGVAEWAYLDIAVTPSRLAPSCISGNAMDCWSLLGLDVEGNATELWYTPDQRRAVVGKWRRWGNTREIQARVDRCIWESDLAACDEVLAENTERRIDPLEDGARNLMVALALEAGGPGSWARLLEDPDMTPAEALRYASGLETEELAQRWIDVISAARPEVHAGLGSLQFFTALWIGVLTFLTMRSTRWRLG